MTKIDSASRFDRQIIEWGPEIQQKLSKSNITIITDGALGKYVTSYLVSAGIGNIKLVSDSQIQNQETHLWSQSLQRGNMAESYVKAFGRINPDATMLPLPISIESHFAKDQLRDSDVLIDATNNPITKAWVMETSRSYGIPSLSASTDRCNAEIIPFVPGKNEDTLEGRIDFLQEEYKNKAQNELTSLAWAGIVAEQIKRILLEEENILTKPFDWRFPQQKKAENNTKKVLVIGAGGLGNPGVYALAKLGYEIDLVDMDRIEDSNVSRMPFFVEYSGKYKATVLANEVKKVIPTVNITPYKKKFTPQFNRGKEYDAVIDFVDNDATRGIVIKYAKKRNIPHLSVGSSFYGFNSALTVPEKTGSMFDYFPDLPEEIKSSEAEIRHGCAFTLASNSWMQAGAVFGVLELSKAFHPRYAGNPLNGYIIHTLGSEEPVVEVKVTE